MHSGTDAGSLPANLFPKFYNKKTTIFLPKDSDAVNEQSLLARGSSSKAPSRPPAMVSCFFVSAYSRGKPAPVLHRFPYTHNFILYYFVKSIVSYFSSFVHCYFAICHNFIVLFFMDFPIMVRYNSFENSDKEGIK